MEEDDTKKELNKGEDENKEKPLSLADEARGIRDEILKARDELKGERELKDKKEAEDLLSGSAGGHVEPTKKEDTPQEYVDKMRKNGWRA